MTKATKDFRFDRHNFKNSCLFTYDTNDMIGSIYESSGMIIGFSSFMALRIEQEIKQEDFLTYYKV